VVVNPSDVLGHHGLVGTDESYFAVSGDGIPFDGPFSLFGIVALGVDVLDGEWILKEIVKRRVLASQLERSFSQVLVFGLQFVVAVSVIETTSFSARRAAILESIGHILDTFLT
jgi:hypothetical protein